MGLYIVNIHGDIEGDYEIIGKYEPAKIGTWIKIVDQIDSFGNVKVYHYKCSVCGCEKSGWGEYCFCPDCGTKMEGE